MTDNEYKIVRDFQIKNSRILELDREYDFLHDSKKVRIDGEYFSYNLNSIKKWVIIKSEKSFAGKTLVFADNG